MNFGFILGFTIDYGDGVPSIRKNSIKEAFWLSIGEKTYPVCLSEESSRFLGGVVPCRNNDKGKDIQMSNQLRDRSGCHLHYMVFHIQQYSLF